MKGFIFSIDSMASLLLLLVAATTIWFTANTFPQLDLTPQKLVNSEAMSIYFNEPDVYPTTTNQIEKCKTISYYDAVLTNATLTQTISSKQICEGQK